MTVADPKELFAKALDAGLAGYQRRKHIEDLAVLDAAPDEIHETLVTLLADQDSYIQRETMKAIAKRRHPRTATDLIHFLESDMGRDEYVKRDAIETLEKFADPRAKPVLETLSRASSFTLSHAAKHALASLGNVSPGGECEPPISALSASSVSSSPPAIAAQAAPALETPPHSAQDTSLPHSPRPVGPPEPGPYRPPSLRPSDTGARTPAVPAPIDWDHMPRLAAFFDDAWDETKAWYAEKIQAERELIPMETEQLDATIAIERRRADKDDDIAACRKSIQEHETRIEALQNNTRRKTREREMRETETRSFWWMIKSFFMPGVRMNLEADLERLKTEILEDNRLERDAQHALPAMREELAALTAPLEELMSKSENLKSEMRSRRKTITAMHRRIGKRVFHIVRRTSDEELHRRLDPLTQRRGADPFLRTCIDEIQDVALTLKGLNVTLKKHRKATGACGVRCAEAIDALGNEIRNGFSIEATQRDAQIRLSGSMRFQEESSFFGGYGNAQGSAHGTGSATAQYVVEEIDWRPSPALGKVVAAYHQTWEGLGTRLAGDALLQARRVTARRTVADYVAYLRSELERDLREDDHA